jgi:Calcium-binding EGF domain
VNIACARSFFTSFPDLLIRLNQHFSFMSQMQHEYYSRQNISLSILLIFGCFWRQQKKETNIDPVIFWYVITFSHYTDEDNWLQNPVFATKHLSNLEITHRKCRRSITFLIICCVDINECATTPWVCQQKCTNTIGGYNCSCGTGYTASQSGRVCTRSLTS